jgi:outer membrane protein TolC
MKGMLLFMAEKGYKYRVRTRLDHQDAETNLIQAEGGLAQAKKGCIMSWPSSI